MKNDFITELKKLYLKFGIDGYVIPKNDQFFSEYSNPNRLLKITNFSGSAGLAIITKDKKMLFVDGRYILQATIETKGFKIYDISKNPINKVLGKIKRTYKLGFDPKLFTKESINKNFSNKCNLIPLRKNLIDGFFNKKKNTNIKKFYSLNVKISGQSSASKIIRLKKFLNENVLDNIYISAPENVAWLLNIRGQDNPYSPIPNCKAIVSKYGKIYLFSNKFKISNIKNRKFYNSINYFDLDDFYRIISNLKGETFSIDKNTCSIYDERLISFKFKIKNYSDPCYRFKSIKNLTEIKHTKKAHISDGIALTKFLYWLKTNKNRIDEKYAEIKLESLRKKNKNYLFPSFDTIMGSGPNGAIIHYRSNKKSNREIKNNDILLIDSGGQYKYGTTDVTRTICFEEPKANIKKIFTQVLKGHIAVVTSKIDKNINGSILDKKARFWLKSNKLDYPHGTGHGVGFFLNVHEGPQSISKKNNIRIVEGMVLSNEPGYYKKNKFGIRIENLIYVKKIKNKLVFDNLTHAPIDLDMLNINMLTIAEKKYISEYHKKILLVIGNKLNSNEKKWLKNLTY